MAISNEVTLERPTDILFSAGRMFYLVNNTLYYSQLTEGLNLSPIAKCYQKNDPTAEQLSDLLATDGGTIQINDATKGVALAESPRGIVILCQNGIWSVQGENGFNATNFAVSKISSDGCLGKLSVVQVNDVIYYWGTDAIYSLQTNEFGNLIPQDITEESIESFYKSIPVQSKRLAQGFYNKQTNDIEWYYRNLAPSASSDIYHAKDRALFYNTKTQGFFPQQFQTETTFTGSDAQCLFNGVDLNDVFNDTVWYQQTTFTATTSSLNNGTMTDTTFQDFATNYPTAYVETGYETLGKPSNKKQAPYIVTKFKKTEQNWVDDGSGGLELDLPSSCIMRAKWDWNDTSANGRWSPTQETYRFRRAFVPSVAGPFDSGETVITTKNKMLGRGEALSLRFEQSDGKDMQMLGYTIQWSMNARI